MEPQAVGKAVPMKVVAYRACSVSSCYTWINWGPKTRGDLSLVTASVLCSQCCTRSTQVRLDHRLLLLVELFHTRNGGGVRKPLGGIIGKVHVDAT